MPRRYRKSEYSVQFGRKRLIPPPLRQLIWKLYQERLPHGRTRSVFDVCLWLDDHDIPPPNGGYWRRSTVQTVLEDYREEQRRQADKDYDQLIDYNKEVADRIREALR